MKYLSESVRFRQARRNDMLADFSRLRLEIPKEWRALLLGFRAYQEPNG